MKPDGTRQPFSEAVKNASKGVAFGVTKERDVIIDCVFGLVAIVLGFVFAISSTEWLAIVICIGLVIGMELMNTAVESVVDLASPGMHELAGRAKDCAAGACLVVSFAALMAGIVIFAPKILLLLGIAL